MGVFALYPDTTYLRAASPMCSITTTRSADDWAWTTARGHAHDLEGSHHRSIRSRTARLNIDAHRHDRRSHRGVSGAERRRRSTASCTITSVPTRTSIRSSGTASSARSTSTGTASSSTTTRKSRTLFYLWQKEYAKAIRERFGDDFIQIGNGRPPQEDAGARALPERHLLRALPEQLLVAGPIATGSSASSKTSSDGYLSKAKGRTWSLCTNENGQTRTTTICSAFSRACSPAACTPSCTASYVFSGWTLDVEPGAPLGPADDRGQRWTACSR